MPRFATLILLFATVGAALGDDSARRERFERAGERALRYVERLVDFGPRPAGSAAQRRQQRYILERLKGLSCEIEEVDFEARTPLGPRSLKNIIAKFPGKTGRVIVVSGHYDTKLFDDFRFVGANDGGSSAGFLLALAELLEGRQNQDSIWLLWFDGEEAFVEWRDEDHTYGSRKQAELWAQQDLGSRLVALINVDMIGDSDLQLNPEAASTAWLRELIWRTADELGYASNFPRRGLSYIADDHVPFLERGWPAVDLIDFDYGFFNRFWHSESDTVDKLGAKSFTVMLHVVWETLDRLERRD